MSVGIFVRGMILGFSIAAPVGPIGVLCIRRTLSGGRRMGLASGLGAATADLVYGAIAAFGLALIASAMTAQQMWLQLIGGAFLCYLGVRAMIEPRHPSSEVSSSTRVGRVSPRGLAGAYASTFFLALTNPMTILSFVAVYSSLGLSVTEPGLLAPALMVVGVFVGSALWWLILSAVASLLRTKLTAPSLRWINRGSGVVILLFGLFTIRAAISGWR